MLNHVINKCRRGRYQEVRKTAPPSQIMPVLSTQLVPRLFEFWDEQRVFRNPLDIYFDNQKGPSKFGKSKSPKSAQHLKWSVYALIWSSCQKSIISPYWLRVSKPIICHWKEDTEIFPEIPAGSILVENWARTSSRKFQQLHQRVTIKEYYNWSPPSFLSCIFSFPYWYVMALKPSPSPYICSLYSHCNTQILMNENSEFILQN